MNGIRYYPNFGSVRTVNFTCDVYANDSLHGVCFPTVMSDITEEKIITSKESGKGGVYNNKSRCKLFYWHNLKNLSLVLEKSGFSRAFQIELKGLLCFSAHEAVSEIIDGII